MSTVRSGRRNACGHLVAVLIAGAIVGLFTLPIAVIGHEASEFVVIASGLRMLRG